VGVEKENGLLSTNEIINNITNYKEFLHTQPQDIEIIREKTRTGRPCGDDDFYDRIEFQFGKDLRPKAPGRPKKVKN
jgi:hypothetical protein